MIAHDESASNANPIHVQLAVDASGLPGAKQIEQWARLALRDQASVGAVTVRIIDTPEASELNRQWRGGNGATNVLSFPLVDETGTAKLLGDIAICAPLVASEAARDGKLVEAHWAHLVIHGVLHLLGFDHDTDLAAAEMEGLERTLLAELGYPDPYRE